MSTVQELLADLWEESPGNRPQSPQSRPEQVADTNEKSPESPKSPRGPSASAKVIDIREFFEERAAIRQYDGQLPQDEAERLAGEDSERHRKECWDRLQRNAAYIVSQQGRLAQERALERYTAAATAMYGAAAADTLKREMIGMCWPEERRTTQQRSERPADE